MKKEIFKLSLYSTFMVIFVMLFSMLHIDKTLYLEKLNSEFAITVYYLLINNITTSLLPGVLAIGYAFISFSLFKDNPKQQIIMVIHAILLIIISPILGIVICYNTSWFYLYMLNKFTISMNAIGLLIIMLSFTFNLFKR